MAHCRQLPLEIPDGSNIDTRTDGADAPGTLFPVVLTDPDTAIICAAIGAVLRTGWIMTLHPSKGCAGCPCGYLRMAEQSQRLATLRDSWGNLGIPKDSEQKTGYADVESKERFPHPHSLDDGGVMQEAIGNWVNTAIVFSDGQIPIERLCHQR